MSEEPPVGSSRWWARFYGIASQGWIMLGDVNRAYRTAATAAHYARKAALLLLVLYVTACGGSPSSPSSAEPPSSAYTENLPALGDTLEFFLGRKRAGSPTLAHPSGDSMTLLFKGTHTATLKHGSRPDSFEIHTWDEEFIYLAEDHGAEGRGASYQFKYGRWMRRKGAKVGEVLLSGDSFIKNYTSDCRYSYDGPWGVVSGPFRVKTVISAHEWRYLGGDLGRQEVIDLLYNENETFTYSREWGWVGWHHAGSGAYWNLLGTYHGQTNVGSCWEAGIRP